MGKVYTRPQLGRITFVPSSYVLEPCRGLCTLVTRSAILDISFIFLSGPPRFDGSMGRSQTYSSAVHLIGALNQSLGSVSIQPFHTLKIINNAPQTAKQKRHSSRYPRPLSFPYFSLLYLLLNIPRPQITHSVLHGR